VRYCLRTSARSQDHPWPEDELTEEERYAVADHVVAQLKDRGDPWRLNEEARVAEPPST